MGKFARVALRTANIDYNGRLCMVSAAAASKKILGIDRSANPWSDIPKAKVILVAGANIAECAPITTDYLWQARENGAQAHRARSAHDADRPHRRSLHPGALGRRHRRLQRHAARHDRSAAGSTATSSPRTRPAGTRSRRSSQRYTPEYAAKIAGVPASMIVRAAEMWGPADDQLPAARARHRAPLEGRRELHGRHQPGGGHRPHRPRRLRLRDDHRPGQRPGRARAGPEVRSAAGRARPREPGASRVHRRRLGRAEESRSRTRACRPCRCSKRSTTGGSRACC